MRILLRDIRTNRYWGGETGWSADQAKAVAFRSIEQAGAKAWEFECVEVVLSYQDPQCELALDRAYCV